MKYSHTFAYIEGQVTRPDHDVNQNICRQWTVFVTPRHSICAHAANFDARSQDSSFDSYLNHVFVFSEYNVRLNTQLLLLCRRGSGLRVWSDSR